MKTPGASAFDDFMITVENVPHRGVTWNGGNKGQAFSGSSNDDVIDGGNGKDSLFGADGDDIIRGGNGADVINGGTGRDTMTGGNGPDLFVFEPNFGQDVITDFRPNVDTIQFDSSLFSNFSDLAFASDGAGNTVIAYDANNTVTLQGVTPLHLSARDFTFVVG